MLSVMNVVFYEALSFMNMVYYERCLLLRVVCYEQGLLWTWSVVSVVCNEWVCYEFSQ